MPINIHSCCTHKLTQSCKAEILLSYLLLQLKVFQIQTKMAKNVSLASVDQKLAMAKRCSHEGVVAGAKAAVVATVATAIPTLACGKISPWARANLNPTAKALIVSTAAGMAYFIVADKTILATARQNSFKQG
ncbi:PREDICTED: early nodulin-93-like [Nicotiana attenuata]|nr:PREDICTED: early nodulin-93-like [Nicotiana attenuata]